MTELKPCPFCGHDAFVFRDNRGYWLAGCFNNLVCDVTPKSEQLTRDLAVEKWNNRPSPWHTDTPTEEGLYAVYYLDEHNPSATPYEVLFDGFLSPDGEGNWIDRDEEIWFIDDDIVRWQKIEEKQI